MLRLAFFWMVLLLASCSGSSADQPEEENGFSYDRFAERFPESRLPYTLTDTALLDHKDTAALRYPEVLGQLQGMADSLLGKSGNRRYVPLARVKAADETYFVVRAAAGRKTAAFVLAYDKKENFVAGFPFLIPDTKPNTMQSSSIDRSATLSRNTWSKGEDGTIAEGKDVYAYSKDAGKFTLVLTDLLDDGQGELLNPIDTFPRTHKLAADYGRDKKNMVSIRDGSKPGRLRFFVHFEKDGGECTGELRGEAQLMSPTTAIYRQAGEPCVLQFSFKSSSVALTELEGCGSHRGVRCLFEGSFTRKKERRPENEAAEKSR
ncbi:MAG TPA: hypothetical protein VHK69_10060 [Chitinophagaceae bacterium]|jgi:hypothetical protein|nr:hypothetical protein [Chitinophagaceae bacterium]